MSRPTFDPGFTTDGLSAVYSAESTVAAWLEFEAALALALADAGIAPSDEAEEVAAVCRRGVADPDSVVASTWETGTPIIALRDQVDAGQWFHYGATSQDAIDTGQVLQARTALGLIRADLEESARRLAALTREFRNQPHMGRTFLQDARPMTFGFRTATWLDAVLSHLNELDRQRDAFVIQLGGPVGIRSELGDAADSVADALAAQLDLGVPDISWHTDRTRIVALAQSVERVALTMAKIGSDVAYLASSTVGEVRVRSGASSSMSEKRNPLDPIRAVAVAKACSGAMTMLTSADHQLDRGVGGWHVEWLALPLIMQTCAAAVESIRYCLDSLEVDGERMRSNVGDSDHGDRGATQIDRVLTRFDGLIGA